MKIDRLYAWVCTQADGDEGLPAVALPGSTHMMPMIGADRERIEDLRPFAQAVKDRTGYKVVLKCFTGGQVLDTLERTPEDEAGGADQSEDTWPKSN